MRFTVSRLLLTRRFHRYVIFRADDLKLVAPVFLLLLRRLKHLTVPLDDDIFVIGGGEIYKELLPYCDGAYVTKVDAVGGAEVFFPNLDAHPDFVCVNESEPIDDNGHTIRFTFYQNKNPKKL